MTTTDAGPRSTVRLDSAVGVAQRVLVATGERETIVVENLARRCAHDVPAAA